MTSIIEPYIIARVNALEMEIRIDLNVHEIRAKVSELFQMLEGRKVKPTDNLSAWFLAHHWYDADRGEWLPRIH